MSNGAQQVVLVKAPQLPIAESCPHREEKRLGITVTYEARTLLTSQRTVPVLPVQSRSIRYS